MLFGLEPANGQRGEERRREEEKWGGLMGSVCIRHSVGLWARAGSKLEPNTETEAMCM